MRYYLLLVLLTFSIAWESANSQVNFIADKQEGCGSLSVKFTPVTSTEIHKIAWDFGKGKTSTEKQPLVFFQDTGRYTVKLTINDTATITKPTFIIVYPNPDARFNITDSITTDPFIYTFIAAPQPIDSFNYTYQWHFSDNSSATTPIVVHQFDSVNNYLVRLQVTDNHGCIDTCSHIVRVAKEIKVPNVFTPNDDHVNDVLEIQTDGKNKYLFEVFSRTGILVFKLESTTIRWSGENTSGIKLNEGIYFYTLECLDPATSFKKQSGFIYLLK